MTDLVFDSIDDVRRANLRRIVDVYGHAEVCKRTNIKHQQLLQYVGPRPTRNIGRDYARRVERAFQYPTNWLDHQHRDQAARFRAIMDSLEHMPTDKFDAFARRIEKQILGIESILVADADLFPPRPA